MMAKPIFFAKKVLFLSKEFDFVSDNINTQLLITFFILKHFIKIIFHLWENSSF